MIGFRVLKEKDSTSDSDEMKLKKVIISLLADVNDEQSLQVILYIIQMMWQKEMREGMVQSDSAAQDVNTS